MSPQAFDHLPLKAVCTNNPPSVDANYGASILEWVRQTFDGRMDFGAVTTTAVEELTGRKPTTLRSWIERNRAAVLEAGKR